MPFGIISVSIKTLLFVYAPLKHPNTDIRANQFANLLQFIAGI